MPPACTPLTGRRIVVTRSLAQARPLGEALTALGADVLYLPLVEFLEPEDRAPLENALRELARFDWVVFTSPNAVRFVAQCAAQLFADLQGFWSQSSRPRTAAIGPGTAAALRQRNWPVDYEGHGGDSRALADALAPRLAGCRVLLPQSDRARPVLGQLLQAAGAEVQVVTAYRTVAAPTDDRDFESILDGEIDAIAFFSPSAVESFLTRVASRLRSAGQCPALAAIGATTAEAIRQAGFPVAVQAEHPTVAAFCQALSRYFAQLGQKREATR